jgi:hypothetical protein
MLQEANHLPFHALLDLDDTLYPESCGLARACRTNIHGKRQWLSSPSLCIESRVVRSQTLASHEAGALFRFFDTGPMLCLLMSKCTFESRQEREGAHLFFVCPDYMVQRLGIPENVVGDLCNELYSKYGTTMAGMKASAFCIGRASNCVLCRLRSPNC